MVPAASETRTNPFERMRHMRFRNPFGDAPQAQLLSGRSVVAELDELLSDVLLLKMPEQASAHGRFGSGAHIRSRSRRRIAV